MAKRKGKVGFLGLTNKTWMWVGVGVVGYYLLKPKSTTNISTGTPSTGPTRNGGGLTTSGSIDTSITGIGAIDEIAVDEVINYAWNDRYLYDILINVYLPAVQKKVNKGNFDYEKGVKLMEYYYTNYVRPHMKNPRNYGWDSKLNPQERRYFASYFLDALFDEYIKE